MWGDPAGQSGTASCDDVDGKDLDREREALANSETRSGKGKKYVTRNFAPLHTSPLVPVKVPTLDAQSQAGCERTVTGRDEATATREGEQPRQRAGKKSRAKPETSKKQTPQKKPTDQRRRAAHGKGGEDHQAADRRPTEDRPKAVRRVALLWGARGAEITPAAPRFPPISCCGDPGELC